MLTFYYRPGTCALASYLALAEAGAEFDAVDLSDRPERVIALNARGKVPILEVDGRILRENVAILGWIARRYPQARLLPADPLEEALCLSTSAWFASTLHIDYRRFLKPQLYSRDAAAHPGISAEGALQFRRDLDELDAMLQGDNQWLHGGQRTIADLYGLVFVDWARRSALDEPGWPAIERWVARLLARPAVARVLRIMGSPLVGAKLRS
jgi:glutathione S-transferase